MTPCTHRNLVLLPPQTDRLRCQHCHLTIKANELPSRYCPECYERDGKKRYDFEEVAAVQTGVVQYRCEECGITIDAD